jgi:hypothetical protein
MIEEFQTLSYGLLHSVTTRVLWTNELFYCGLVSYDEAENMAEVSNLVEVYVEEVTTQPVEVNLTISDLQLNLGEDSWLLDKTKIYIISGVVAGVILVIILLVTCLIIRAKWMAKDNIKWAEDTYEAGFNPEVKVERVETESGIYSWLESLPRSERKEEEGSSSSSSRPTTSTDDSISDSCDHNQQQPHQQHSYATHQGPDQQHMDYYLGHSTDDLRHSQKLPDVVRRVGAAATATPDEEEVSRDAYARQLLQRSRVYYSMRVPPAAAITAPTGHELPDGGGGGWQQQQPDVGGGGWQQQQIRKKRHESVV